MPAKSLCDENGGRYQRFYNCQWYGNLSIASFKSDLTHWNELNWKKHTIFRKSKYWQKVCLKSEKSEIRGWVLVCARVARSFSSLRLNRLSNSAHFCIYSKHSPHCHFNKKIRKIIRYDAWYDMINIQKILSKGSLCVFNKNKCMSVCLFPSLYLHGWQQFQYFVEFGWIFRARLPGLANSASLCSCYFLFRLRFSNSASFSGFAESFCHLATLVCAMVYTMNLESCNVLDTFPAQ